MESLTILFGDFHIFLKSVLIGLVIEDKSFMFNDRLQAKNIIDL